MTWLLALLIAVLIFLTLNVLKRIVFNRAHAWVRQTETDLDDLVVELFNRTWLMFLLAVSGYVGSQLLVLPEVELGIRTAMVILFLIQAALWGTGVIDYLVSHQEREQAKRELDATTTINALSYVGKGALWTVVVLLALNNVPGVEVDALIASLGIGGVAVALAVQNILGDLFASLSIVVDKPFVIGDAISVGDYVGTVEHIGIKSTRARSLTGEQLIFSNSDLLNSRIRNYQRMEERRVAFTIGVAYQTAYQSLVEIPEAIQEIVEAQPQTRFGRAHLKECGDFSLTFEIVYRMLTTNYTAFMDTQQAIILAIIRWFEQRNIQFAYPTQTVFLRKEQCG